MGKQGIRYAAKVDTKATAGTLPYLHVSFLPLASGTWTSADTR